MKQREQKLQQKGKLLLFFKRLTKMSQNTRIVLKSIVIILLGFITGILLTKKLSPDSRDSIDRYQEIFITNDQTRPNDTNQITQDSGFSFKYNASIIPNTKSSSRDTFPDYLYGAIVSKDELYLLGAETQALQQKIALSSAKRDSMKLRIKVIEDGLVNNPEKMLGLNNLSTRIELLEQLIINEGENHQRDYDQLKELTQARERELQTQINILYMLVVGLLLTIVGIGLAPIVSKKKKKKKKKKQQLPTTQPSPPHQSAG